DVLHAVAVREHVLRDRALGPHGAGEDDPGLALLQDVGGAVADLGLRARVGGDVEAERLGVVEGGLPRVPHVVLDVVDAHERHVVVLRGLLGSLLEILGHRGPSSRVELDYTQARTWKTIRFSDPAGAAAQMETRERAAPALTLSGSYAY